MKHKIILISILIAFGSLKVYTQTLAHTTWFVTNGSTLNVYIIFKTDTVMSGTSIGNATPLSSFTESLNNFTVTDFTGNCLSTGTYTFDILADTLNFTLVTDLCSNRTQVLTTYHWTRVYTVGIAENSIADLRIYPNPIADILFINIDTHEPSTVTLYDIASRKLLQETFTGNATLNTEQLADGVYIYEVLNEKGIVRKGKVIKQ